MGKGSGEGGKHRRRCLRTVAAVAQHAGSQLCLRLLAGRGRIPGRSWLRPATGTAPARRSAIGVSQLLTGKWLTFRAARGRGAVSIMESGR